MASALRSAHSSHGNSSDVRAAAELAFRWWCNKQPQNQVSAPKILTPAAAAACALVFPLQRMLLPGKVALLR